ncbi:TadE/TadG family type IV pilus assembly protein [Taklimakanibacter lacteus]|uniref:TadE/TadG family type IV pilus assembly protein n=1 Tax=Taklimakanibacter lacteus TaxID=2268456 RepID=UPI000E66E3D5
MTAFRRFMYHSGGVSAVEFAIAAPVLIMMLAGIVTGWTYATQSLQMRSAVKTGANYILQGGADIAAAKNAVLLSWTNKPGDADVQVVRQCSCAGTTSACTSVCTGTGAIPNMSVIITASGSIDTPLHNLFATAKMQTSREEVIRVR